MPSPSCDTIKIGVIGAGFGQYVHVPAFRSDARCLVKAIGATQADKAAQIASQLGVEKSYGDAKLLIADPEIDAISLAVPPYVQPGLIEAAARAGKHVFCEKPVGKSLDAAEGALRAVEAAGVVTAVNFIFPEIPAWREAKAVLEAGQLGRIRHVALTWRVETQAYRTPADNWKSRPSEGGGVLLNLVSHSAYYLEWLFGPVANLSAHLRGQPVEAGVESCLTFANGLEAVISVAADSMHGSGHRIEIYGDAGTLVLRNETQDYVNGFELRIGSRSDKQLIQRVAPAITQSDGRITSTARIVGRFLDAIQGGAAVTPGLAHGVRAQRLLDAMQRAHQSGQWTSVS